MLIYDDRVTLKPKGLLTRVTKGSTGDKDVDLRAINAVQLKKPGLSKGFIQLTISGESAKRGGTYHAAQDENALLLGNSRQYAEAEKAKEVILRLKARALSPQSAGPPPAPDLVGMLEKLADLHSRGILTDEEFTSKKAEVLARL